MQLRVRSYILGCSQACIRFYIKDVQSLKRGPFLVVSCFLRSITRAYQQTFILVCVRFRQLVLMIIILDLSVCFNYYGALMTKRTLYVQFQLFSSSTVCIGTLVMQELQPPQLPLKRAKFPTCYYTEHFQFKICSSIRPVLIKDNFQNLQLWTIQKMMLKTQLDLYQFGVHKS